MGIGNISGAFIFCFLFFLNLVQQCCIVFIYFDVFFFLKDGIGLDFASYSTRRALVVSKLSQSISFLIVMMSL